MLVSPDVAIKKLAKAFNQYSFIYSTVETRDLSYFPSAGFLPYQELISK